MQKNEKGPLSHRKIKCLFLDYIQLLMIDQAIQAKNVDRNAKIQKGPQKNVDRNAKIQKGPLSHQK